MRFQQYIIIPLMKALFIIGPSGVGKTTLTHELAHLYNQLFGQRSTITINLDCASSNTHYDINIAQLVQLEDVMEQLQIGPNGALLYSIDLLWQNLDWLHQCLQREITKRNPAFRVQHNSKASQHMKLQQLQIQNIFLLFDLPGQAELYLNHESMKKVINTLVQTYSLSPCLLELFDATYIYRIEDYISMCMMTLTSMINLEMPHLSLLNKIDLLKGRRPPDGMIDDYLTLSSMGRMLYDLSLDGESHMLKAIAEVIDQQSKVEFLPCSVQKPELLVNLVFQLQKIWGTLQMNLVSSAKFTNAVKSLLEDFSKEHLISNLEVQLFSGEEEIDFELELKKMQEARTQQS